MSAITSPILTDATFSSKLDTQNSLLAALVRDRVLTDTMSWSQVRAIVQSGQASQVFRIGDQLSVTWTDESNHEWDVPMDVVHFGNVELQDGETVPGMYLEWHWLTPYGIPFNQTQALYYAKDGLSAGTYYVTAANSWGSRIQSGQSYQFTLAQPVPAGGQVVFSTGTVDNDVANWRVSTYASPTSSTPVESGVTVSVGTGGTFLGDWSSSKTFDESDTTGINHMHRSNYGYGRWSMSAMRQWLNSNAAAGSWWTPQSKFDRTFTESTSKRGFMAGLPQDFLDCVGKVKVTTALNTVEGLASDRDVTYDRFFLGSLEQEYCVNQLAGAEGEAWEYWKRVKGLTSPQAWHPTVVKESIRYGIDNKTSPQSCRLRSAYRYSAGHTWYVYSTGCVGYNGSYTALRCAPACVIC